MKYIDDDVLGGQSRPIHNNFELTNAMQGRKNCFLYTVGTFQVNNQKYNDVKYIVEYSEDFKTVTVRRYEND